MSDAAATGESANAAGGGDPAGLTPAAVESVLADFRVWLTDLASGGRQPPVISAQQGADAPRSPGGVDLFTLVGQFTALRHEVNLQTKAARAAVEQNAEVLKQLTASQAEPEPDDALRPVVKAVIDIADALTLSLRQMEKLRASAEREAASGFTEVDAPRSPGFFARLFGARPPAPPPGTDRADPTADKLRQLVAAAADGYAMSLRRVERILPTLDVEPLACAGQPFDPELMEVVEVVGDDDHPAGTVVEDVRPGYRWRGKLFRYAQVKVGR